jgi:hypothetical protein
VGMFEINAYVELVMFGWFTREEVVIPGWLTIDDYVIIG